MGALRKVIAGMLLLVTIISIVGISSNNWLTISVSLSSGETFKVSSGLFKVCLELNNTIECQFPSDLEGYMYAVQTLAIISVVSLCAIWGLEIALKKYNKKWQVPDKPRRIVLMALTAVAGVLLLLAVITYGAKNSKLVKNNASFGWSYWLTLAASVLSLIVTALFVVQLLRKEDKT